MTSNALSADVVAADVEVAAALSLPEFFILSELQLCPPVHMHLAFLAFLTLFRASSSPTAFRRGPRATPPIELPCFFFFFFNGHVHGAYTTDNLEPQ